MCDVEKANILACEELKEGKEYCTGDWHVKCEDGRLIYLYRCPDVIMEERKKRLFPKSFDNFDPSLQEKAFKRVQSFVRRVISGGKGYLILMGITGCGKTHLAMAAANEFILAGLDVEFLRYIEFSILVRESKLSGSLNVLREVAAADVFILDDLGSSSTTDSFLEGLQYVLDLRDGKAMIVTTNLNKKDLAEVVGPKVYSRLMEYAIGVAFEKIDYRQRR